jgi:hypothetical protein
MFIGFELELYSIFVDFNLAEFGAGLPVAQIVEKLTAAQGNLVLQAPPGTGKTTLVPPALANNGTKVLVTAPRRVAVRAAARRLAQLSHSQLGDRVGYSIRGDHRPGSLVEFVTPGVLVRRLLKDPELPRVHTVVIDEVHERQLDTDLVLGMLLELQELRDDLQIVAMSATIDAQRFAQLLSAQLLEVAAPIFPLDVSYHYLPGRLECSYEYISALTQLTVAHSGSDSALVFLPGMREVMACCTELEEHTQLPVFPLHGQLSAAQQDQALQFSGQRIVVATSIAESSVTVPGVRLVVDAGLSRVPKRDAARGMTGLVTTSCSRSSAEQRAGRAGREGPGTVLRCYSESDFSRMAAHTTPEIAAADLTQFAHFLSCWGSPISQFPLLNPPPAPALADAHRVLHLIGALDQHGATALGKEMALIPTEPRLAKALIALGKSAAETIAALQEPISGDIDKALGSLRSSKRFRSEVRRLRSLTQGEAPCTPGEVIGTAFPDLIAKKVGEEYLLAQGTRAKLRPNSGCTTHPWLAVYDVSLSPAGATIHSAAPIDQGMALELIGVTEETTCTYHNGKVTGRKLKQAGTIVLATTPVAVPQDQAIAAITAAVHQQGLSLFNFSPAAQQLKDRLALLHQYYGTPWPEIDALAADEWLQPEIAQLAADQTPDMFAALQRILPWPEASKIDELAPAALQVPSGRSVPVDYSQQRPTVKVKLQECFGLSTSPVVCGHKVVFHLLSPAGRALAVTDDLASFWAGPYAGVRAEMRGRYPKHPWPLDPTAAVATAKTKNRM